jgi:hypothetical protein
VSPLHAYGLEVIGSEYAMNKNEKSECNVPVMMSWRPRLKLTTKFFVTSLVRQIAFGRLAVTFVVLESGNDPGGSNGSVSFMGNPSVLSHRVGT